MSTYVVHCVGLCAECDTQEDAAAVMDRRSGTTLYVSALAYQAALARVEAAERERDQLKRGHDDLHRLVSEGVARFNGAEARVAALIAAGDWLADVIDRANPGSNGHALGCAIDRRRTPTEIAQNIHPACDCGNWDAVAAWERAKEGLGD